MLIDIDTGMTITTVPFEDTFTALRSRLTTDEFQDAVDHINSLINSAGREIATAGWLPGKEWDGTPFAPIYWKAARQDYSVAARFFGQLVWFTVMGRDEAWSSGRYKVDGRDIGSRTYFRVGTR